MTELRDLRERTKSFALRIIRMYGSLPKTTEAQIIGKQVLRSGTLIGAHYREASRARSDAEFISKISVGLQELDETAYWLELLVDREIIPAPKLEALQKETEELIAIFTLIVKKVKSKKEGKRVKEETPEWELEEKEKSVELEGYGLLLDQTAEDTTADLSSNPN